MTAPKTIQNKARQLARALDQVARLSSEIEEWAVKKGADGDDFFYENRLDILWEFDLAHTLEALDMVADGEY